MPFTYHCHSGEFCLHASGKLEEVIMQAISLGFKVIGLSEHAPRNRTEDLYPEEVNVEYLAESFSNYVLEARKLKTKYKDQIEILIGMETEWILGGISDNQIGFLKEFDLEFIVGSLHHVKGIPIDFSKELYTKAIEVCGGINLLYENYFQEQFDMVDKLRPDIIGHFDLIRMFGDGHPLSSKAYEIVNRTVDLAISYGALFEINSRAYKKSLPYPYPHPDVLKIIIDKGGKLTVSDDSHSPDQLALFYPLMVEYLLEMNIQTIYYLTKDQSTNKVIVKEYENFFDDRFWASNIS
ncbi:hypothetical protein BB559_000939 [Furculomyces boomerangus]|uniref:Histidinol-phosphatase n=1 Tax=Furculomyces boomerangus TaxID=61424 RepID=A0A2T9Z3K9_9FUNG|nr:hypothetical protein BB559_000939 [Furculomyces boomerangus]